MTAKYMFYVIQCILLIGICYYLYFYRETFIQNIPKNIIQTWKSNDIPDKYKTYIENVKALHPDYNHMFFTDEDIEAFLKQHYSEYYETYKKLPIKIQKIDFFRYIAIYHYGGFYLDLDMNCQDNFNPLLQHQCVFPIDDYITKNRLHIHRYASFGKQQQTFLLGQYAFGSVSKHPFIKKIIDDIHKNIHYYVKNVNANSDDYIYQTTGPDFVTQTYIDYKDKKQIHILDNGKRQCFGDYASHMCMGSWK